MHPVFAATSPTTGIDVWQRSTEALLTFPVAYERALESFYHPFAHLPTVLGPALATVG